MHSNAMPGNARFKRVLFDREFTSNRFQNSDSGTLRLAFLGIALGMAKAYIEPAGFDEACDGGEPAVTGSASVRLRPDAAEKNLVASRVFGLIQGPVGLTHQAGEIVYFWRTQCGDADADRDAFGELPEFQ